MSIIVKTDFETAKAYAGKNVYTKFDGRKHQVFFRVFVDDSTLSDGIALSRDKNVLMLLYVGSDSYLSTYDFTNCGTYIGVSKEVGNDLTESDINTMLSCLPEAVTLILKLPEDYKDIRFLYEMSQKYKRVRFCGGTLFCFDECNFGCCGRELLDKQGIKYDKESYLKEGCCCALQSVDGIDLEYTVSARTERYSTSKSSGTKKAKVSKFSELLYSNGKVPL